MLGFAHYKHFFYLIPAVDPCDKCDDDNAVCKDDKCECKKGFSGEGGKDCTSKLYQNTHMNVS